MNVQREPIYCEAWSSSLALMLSRLTAVEWQTETAAIPSEFVPLVCIRVTVEGGLGGRQWFSFSAADLKQLLPLFLGEEVTLADPLDDMQGEAVEELIRQWCGLAATALKADFGEVTLQVGLEPPGHAASGPVSLLHASQSTRSIIALMEIDDGLRRAVQASQAKSAPLPAPPSTPAPPATLPLPANSSARIEDLLRQGNLELLMDVELAVMLRFGSRQATLQEVLELATGAVLELDREIQEPVDLMLNGKLIARGEVVVVDGNYGLRVMEVASPRQRLSSL